MRGGRAGVAGREEAAPASQPPRGRSPPVPSVPFLISRMSTALVLPQSSCNPVEQQRSRWERKRSRTVKELVETEQKYLEQLDLVATYFVAILKAKGTLKPAALEAIFGPWECLCSTSRTLLFHLERGRLGLGLEGFCHQLVFYVCYAENWEEAKKMLERQVKKNRSFSRFKKLQESRPDFRGYSLEDLLPLPLQRIHQYKHLLQDLVENTYPESSDSEQLRGVLRSFSEAFHRIGEISRFQDNLGHMHRVQKLLKGQKTHLLVPGRWYLQEGWLIVVPPKGEEVQSRMFFLFSDILLMTRPCHPLHPWNSSKFACQAVYPLSQCTVEKVFGHTHDQGGLLSLSFPHKTLLLMSCDQDEFNKWHQNLVTAVR
ncbi:rho guanine nucleotide exchange factor 39 isoform X2 [Pogona vitticeps]